MIKVIECELRLFDGVLDMLGVECSFYVDVGYRPVSEKIARRAIIRSPWLSEACDGVR